ncbi:flagellar FlbD family protein [Paenibacillus thermoaerophilus]|jgi:flagellar protein FlbD|uniref:Flagellar FlbD family protein n=1 Tax=Paenibacillus thermoaerophilus TaxID=1215385 RepID=A0ABW2V3C6_9BACL|nr:flagellar FlbD family protein [Paenibacillus thermoaerophilus]TMV13801.1 flagellar protein D [Paenibacillus thermoaerophilus]
MITVTRLNGKSFMVNALLIETIEETPDTMISLTTGKKLIVREPAAQVADLIQAYLRRIGAVRAITQLHGMEESESAAE